MNEPEEFRVDPKEFSEDPQIEPADVISAARSCSAILIIAIAVALIVCLALVLAKVV